MPAVTLLDLRPLVHMTHAGLAWTWGCSAHMSGSLCVGPAHTAHNTEVGMLGIFQPAPFHITQHARTCTCRFIHRRFRNTHPCANHIADPVVCYLATSTSKTVQKSIAVVVP